MCRPVLIPMDFVMYINEYNNSLIMRWTKSVKEFLKPNKKKLLPFLAILLGMGVPLSILLYYDYVTYGHTFSRGGTPIEITPTYLLTMFILTISVAYISSCAVYRQMEKAKRGEYDIGRDIEIRVKLLLFTFVYWIFFMFIAFLFKNTFGYKIAGVLTFLALVIYLISTFLLWWFKWR